MEVGDQELNAYGRRRELAGTLRLVSPKVILCEGRSVQAQPRAVVESDCGRMRVGHNVAGGIPAHKARERPRSPD
jgi:hypothetical protein